MSLKDIKAGFALTGSFCTFKQVIPKIAELVDAGIDILPIMSENASSIDTRFGKASDFIKQIEEITNKKVLTTISEVEPIGPKKLLDILIIAPCTGNTLGKIANGITDTSVSMAAKATLRNKKPVVIAVSTNDGLSQSAKNLGLLLNTKNVYFVPFAQDDPVNKETSLVAKFDMILPTVEQALSGKQIQPLLLQ
ncbi:MAG: dipicolinate synthase subunit B [Clostridiaceae bacterium]|nr:dipicolinate synthase subunit B [Clostridiaceae bacterium]